MNNDLQSGRSAIVSIMGLLASTPSDPAMSAEISSITSAHQIVVFQSSGCPYCAQAISALKSAGYEPFVVEATSGQRSALRSLTNSSSVPNIW